MKLTLHELAKKAYEAYGKTTDFKNYQGLPMPKYEDLTPTIQAAWRAAANSVWEDATNVWANVAEKALREMLQFERDSASKGSDELLKH